MRRYYLMAILMLIGLSCVKERTVAEENLSQFDKLTDISMKIDPEIKLLVGSVNKDIIRENLRTLVSFGTRHSQSDTSSVTRGIGAARRWIYDTLKGYEKDSGGRMTVTNQRWEGKSRRLEPTTLVNVVATIRGTDPVAAKRVYVVGAHYDSRNSNWKDGVGDAPGANDDGSGTVAVMELARVLSRHPFPSTIVCILFAAEEQGLVGSYYWALEASAQELDIEGMINLDVVGNITGANGYTDSLTVRIYSADPLDSPDRQLARYVKWVGEAYVPEMTVSLRYIHDRFGRGGDQSSFTALGYRAVRLCEPNEDWTKQHQDIRREEGIKYGDLFEHVNIPYLARITKITAATLANLATAPPPPGTVFYKSIKNMDSKIEWKIRDDYEDVATYKLVLREQTSPTWQKEVTIGRRIDYTLEGISLDNYFFGVRAVSVSGHEGIVEFRRKGRPR